MDFIVELVEINTKSVHIQADNYKEAERGALEAYAQGEILMDGSALTDINAYAREAKYERKRVL